MFPGYAAGYISRCRTRAFVRGSAIGETCRSRRRMSMPRELFSTTLVVAVPLEHRWRSYTLRYGFPVRWQPGCSTRRVDAQPAGVAI